MKRLLADYLGTLLGVRVLDMEVRVMDTPRGNLAVELSLRTLQQLTPTPERFGSLLVRKVEHMYRSHYVIGEAPKEVADGSEVIISPVYGRETAEIFRLLAKQFEVKYEALE